MEINFNFPSRRTAFYRWFSEPWCCKKKENPQSQLTNGGRSKGGARNLHQNYDSMKTFTTSLTVTSRRSTCLRPNRVVIVEKPKTILTPPEEVSAMSLRVIDAVNIFLTSFFPTLFNRNSHIQNFSLFSFQNER